MHTIGFAAVFYGGEPNAYFLQVLNGVLETAAQLHQNTTIFTMRDWKEEAPRLSGFCDGRIDGMILLAPDFTGASTPHLPEHTPFVSVHANAPIPGVVNIESDEETGAFNAVRHLIELGHRRILHFAGELHTVGAERRIHGYRRALESCGIPFDPAFVVEVGFGIELGRDAIRRWMRERTGQAFPEAVFCVNDAIAVACLEVFSEAGLRVPDHVSVVGFDDTMAARMVLPQLTTVRQPLREMGEKAVRVLLERVEHHHAAAAPRETSSIVFPTEVVIRKSAVLPGEARSTPPLGGS